MLNENSKVKEHMYRGNFEMKKYIGILKFDNGTKIPLHKGRIFP